MTSLHAPYLSPAQLERLAILQGELAKVSQVVSKIMRHGYESWNPDNPNVIIDQAGIHHPNNLDDLEKELGHLFHSIRMLSDIHEISNKAMHEAHINKRETIRRWLHHQ